jgi:hypothetical protein
VGRQVVEVDAIGSRQGDGALDEPLELADVADDPEVELVVHRPQDLRRPGQLERVVDPLDERV